MKPVRIAAAIALCAAIFYVATLATRDCSVSSYFAVNCLGQWVEHSLGLPSSRLLRALVLEVVGLSLVAGLYLILRYIFPHRKQELPPDAASHESLTSQKESDVRSIASTENLILRALAQEPPHCSLRNVARPLFAGYRWVEPIHGEIYQALLRIPGSGPATLRSQLAAVLTRRGFPDFDLDGLFQPTGLSQQQVARLMESLIRKP